MDQQSSSNHVRCLLYIYVYIYICIAIPIFSGHQIPDVEGQSLPRPSRRVAALLRATAARWPMELPWCSWPGGTVGLFAGISRCVFFFSAFILEDTRRTMTFWRRSLPKHGWFRVFLKVPCFFVSQTWFDPRVFSVMAVSMGRRINWLTFWGTLFCHRYPQEQNYHELGHPKLVECSGKKNINNWGKRKSWIVQYFAWYFSCHFFSVQYHLGLWLVRAFA